MGTLLLYGTSTTSAALRHEVPLAMGDPFMFADVDGRRAILTSILERERVAAVLPDAELLDLFALGLRELLVAGASRAEAEAEVAARAIAQLGITAAVVPWDFPLQIADRLRADGVTLTIDDGVVNARRRVKAGAELMGVRAAQAAAHAAMSRAAELLASSEPDGDGWLRRDGELLRAEWVREQLHAAAAEHRATFPAEMMVVSVHQGFGHESGSGPLPAGLPIQVDLFPRDEASGCWADMTRTFVVGEPTPEHAELIAIQERLVREALEQARAAVAPGARGGELYAATCDLFEAAGFATQRTAEAGTTEGFQFALGHGVGLEVHEAPYLGMSGAEPFVTGDVIAIEPGLWDERIGGVRHEDLLLVTDGGCETLTDFPYALTPSA